MQVGDSTLQGASPLTASPSSANGEQFMQEGNQDKMAQQQQQQQTNHLFRLPQELRDEIYRLAIVSPKKMEICTWSGSLRSHSGPSDRTNQPALSRTCTQIRGECLPIFYGSHTFKLNCGFETHLPPVISEHINKINRFEMAFTYNFFDLDISNGLQNYELTLTDYGPFIGQPVLLDIRHMLIEKGKRYLDEQPQGGYGKDEIDVELLVGLIKVLDIH